MIYLMVIVLITSPVFCQDEPMFLDGRQEFIYYSDQNSISNKLIFRSEELLSAIHPGCLELEKISESSFVYNTIFNSDCSFSTGEIPVFFKSIDSDSATIRYFKLKQFTQPRITLGGVTEGEKVYEKSLDLTLLFLDYDYFLEETTKIVETYITVIFKNNQRKPLYLNFVGGKLSEKSKKMIQKRFDLIDRIKIKCNVENTILGYKSSISSDFQF